MGQICLETMFSQNYADFSLETEASRLIDRDFRTKIEQMYKNAGTARMQNRNCSVGCYNVINIEGVTGMASPTAYYANLKVEEEWIASQ